MHFLLLKAKGNYGTIFYDKCCAHSELVYQVVSFYGRSCLIKCDKLLRDISENQVIIIFSLIGCELATMRDTNGEFVETLHKTLRLHEEHHGFKVVRKLGSKNHLKKALASHVSLNSLKAGFSPARDLMLRTPSPRPT